MPENPKPIRRPGSQVAPGQKPLHRPGPTASTHTRVPLDQATAGKLYRVRDRADAQGEFVLWGEHLSHTDATKLREQVCGARKSKTARVEEMPADELADAPDPRSRPTAAEIATGDYAFSELKDDSKLWAEAFCSEATARGVKLSQNDERMVLTWFTRAIGSRPPAPPADPFLAEVRKKVVAAVAPVAAQAQARHQAIKAKAPRPTPPMFADPPKPPPSPLSDDVIEDGDADLPPDDDSGLEAAEVQDLQAEVGGGPSDADRERAKQQAQTDVEVATDMAKEAYASEVEAAGGADPWPTWKQLGEFEHAAWRYYVVNGGDKPELTREVRKVTHAMGVSP